MSLHCGACGENLDESGYSSHMEECEAKKALLLPAALLMFGTKVDVGHKAVRILYLVQSARFQVKEYAYAVSSEMSSWERAKLHKKLCEKLELDYSKFKPFETEQGITSQKEAEDVIYRAIGIYLLRIML